MKFLKPIFFLSLCTLLSCGLFSHTPRKAKVWMPPDIYGADAVTFFYVEGIKYARLGDDLETSSALYRQALRLDSLHAPSCYGLANNLAQEDVARAIYYSKKANRLDPTNIWYTTQLGRLYLVARDYPNALAVFRELMRRDPQNPDNYRLVAALYKMNNQPFAAIGILDSAEVKLGRSEELSAYKRQLLVETKQYDKAIDQAKGLVDAFPYSADNYLSLAELYATTNKDSLALENYRQALEIDSTNVDVLISMNDFYRQRGDMDGFTYTAKKIIRSPDVELQNKLKFLDDLSSSADFYRSHFPFMRDMAATLAVMYPDSFEALMQYVRVLVAMDNADEASRLVKNFMSREQKPDLDVISAVIGLEAYQQRPDSVDKYMSMAIKYYPDKLDLRIQQAILQTQMKQYDKALASYEQALRLTRADSKGMRADSIEGNIYGMMGDVYHQQDKRQQAYEYYDKSLHIYPDNAMVLNNYAYYLAEDGKQLDKALKMSARSLELMDGTPSFLDTYGWVLYRKGDYEGARKAIQQAISLDRSNSPELAFHYAEVLYALKEYFMASVYWQKALERGYDKDIIEQGLKLVEGK